ncbi:type III-A CRISPR-associated RAMP protein Csm5 [Treponema sp. OMZ 787]|uniref:type III-A CRISPR-associated RAMP protein Csm5 n=1 Tax=Treponema sp. OMZ 787 TaxID=2563669 RepID=UPI0020A42F54|nr:type III-A CRISPR-associated RAMP protein Csm5 [Treponema sp. OMZ 787]UTC61720.1 type III-A CRISPR-associated RAMP protein Csm5 [Treponema sp. OMZ 787]
MAKKTYKIKIDPLTGVHIGTGEELTFLDYKVIKTNSGNKVYVKFSSDQILSRLIDEGRDLSAFYAASDNRNMKAVQNFFHKNIGKKDIEYPCDVTSSFYDLYEKNKTKDPIENAARVLQMYRPADSKHPVIPGSSLKGAIRTAVLNNILCNLNDDEYDREFDIFEKEKNKNNSDKYEKKLQQKILKYCNEKDDPFRSVSIADTSFEAKNTQLVGLLKNISSSNNVIKSIPKLQIQAEIIRGCLIGGSAEAETSISIDESLTQSKLTGNNNKNGFEIKTRISMTDIAKACNHFFWNEFEAEYNKFYKDVDESVDIIVHLKKQLEEASKDTNSFIVRVGRWSQVEFVTFEDNFRDPKVPQTRAQKRACGTTRTVFDYDGQYLPLGWCKCTVIN